MVSAAATGSALDHARAVRVGDRLLEKGLVTQDQVDQALREQQARGHKKLLGEVLVEMGFVSEEQVMEALAEAYDVPFARISPRIADPKVIEVVPRDLLEKHCILPLFLVNGVLTLAVPEPSNVFLVEEVERISGHKVQVVAALSKEISATLQAYMPNANVFVIDELVGDIQEEDLSVVERQVADLSALETSASDSPVIKLVNYLIYNAVREGASDIHIEPGDGALRVRYRVDGRLYEKLNPPYQMLPAIVSRIKIMANLDISERRLPQDGGITVLIEKHPIDVRVSTMPGRYGEKAVLRIIDTRSVMTSLEKLGFNFDMLERYRQVIKHPNGIVLVTGPTGSGKSTTLYATLNEINDESINISTVEDPVEYSLAGVNQFQVHEKAGFTFAGALRSLLRQDPDVIMLGEIRDAETARIATQAAMTGHLVLSTLHTNDAISAVSRLFNIGVEPYMVAASLRGVLAQRLVRRICTSCKQPMEITPAIKRMLDRVQREDVAIDALFHGGGCAKCRKTGYAGRLGMYGLYVPDDESLEAISHGANLGELRKLAQSRSVYTTLLEDGLQKVKSGLTTLEEMFTATTA